MQNGRLPSKSALHLKKVCYKVSFCEYCQWQSYKAFTSLSIRAKNGSRGTSSTTWKFGRNWPTPSRKPISNQYSLFAHQPSHLAQKVQLTRIESQLRALPRA